MEWNWNWKVTPLLLSESTGDSEELLKSGVHHQEDEEVDMDDQTHQGDDDDDDDDDDAESCSYDHSSYANTNRLCGNRNQDHQTYDDDDGEEEEEEEDDDDDDDDDGEVDDGKINKLMDPSMPHQFCHQFCGDSLSHEREIDRKFWETCLAS